MNTPPILIIKKGSASASDIALARKAGVLVMVVADAADVRYMDPPLVPTSRLGNVAIRLIKELHKQPSYGSLRQDDLVAELAKVFLQDEQPLPTDAAKP